MAWPGTEDKYTLGFRENYFYLEPEVQILIVFSGTPLFHTDEDVVQKRDTTDFSNHHVHKSMPSKITSIPEKIKNKVNGSAVLLMQLRAVVSLGGTGGLLHISMGLLYG